MKTMFKSQELWDLVEEGFEDANPTEPDQRLWKTRKNDARALFLIQQVLDDGIFFSNCSSKHFPSSMGYSKE